MRVRCQEFADSVGLVVARPAQTIGAEPFFGLLLVGLQAGLLARTVALHLLVVEDTAAHFDEFLRLMPARGESEHSWTVTREQIDQRQYDLKAVNSNIRSEQDTCITDDLLAFIE